MNVYTRSVRDLGVNSTPSSSHGGVEMTRNSPAITRHFAWPWHKYDALLTPKSQTLRVYTSCPFTAYHEVYEDRVYPFVK